ncbi:HWE histidine kinase domain-containing protein [Methylobacterium komagatae]|uniref:histidine kinase n=1 Tax=Methylobacterium komagatae TaxID=374425 RepID=A0ABW2BGP7_9HYPH
MNSDKANDALIRRNAELEADNARLRLLLDRRDTPAELRHRLRTTLGLVRDVIQRSAEAREEASDYAAHLRDRLDAIVRMHVAIDHTGDVSLHAAIAEELLTYTLQEGDRLLLSGPAIRLRPRAAQIFGLAIHELAVNAVEFGAATNPTGRIEVSWRVEAEGAEPTLFLTWKESSRAILATPVRHGFGTEVLTQMVGHDLGGRTTLVFEPDGLCWTLCCPFSSRVGNLVPDEGEGGANGE